MEQTNNGFKLNWTAKEQAMKQVEEEIRESESKMAYLNNMAELGIEVL